MQATENDPLVLDRLLNLQSALHAATDVLDIAESCCRALAQVPGVSGVAFVEAGRVIATAGRPPTADNPGSMADPAGAETIDIEAGSNPFGSFRLRLSDSEAFRRFRPYLQGTASLVALILDRRERVRAEAALRESEANYRTLVESSPYCIHQVDLDGRLLSMNRAGLKMIDREREEDIIGLPLLEVVCEEDRERIAALMQAAFDGQSSEFEFRSSVGPFFQSNFVPLRGEDGSVQRLIGITQDITESRLLAGQLRQAQKMEAMGQLAGGVAHDFNNLLTAILGNAEMMLAATEQHDAGSVAEIRSGLDEIVNAGERAASVVRQLLTFGRKELAATEVLDLRQVVEQTRDMLERLVREDVEFEVNVASDVHRVRADSGKLGQVIMNLVVNAADAMPNGGKLTVACSNVNLDQTHVATHVGAQLGPNVLLAVSDSGIGMDRQTMERIFEPFFTTKSIGKGTGLGLSTVYSVAKQMGAHLSVESEPGRGSKFSVYFPAVADLSGENVSEISTAGIRGKEVVLVCEDEDLVRGVVCDTLRSANYTVLESKDGEHALEVLRDFEGAIDLLLSDVIMPGMNGKELADVVVRHHPGVRIIFFSGYTQEIIDLPGLQKRGQDFIQKPFRRIVLLRRVREVLDRGVRL